MADNIAIVGLVATEPRHIVTSEGLAITSFRLASNQRRYDRGKDRWVDGDTNWYTVTAFRQLALNGAVCVNKGDRILVQGRIKLRDWESGDRSGTSVEIEADAIGHDLTWGTSTYVRTPSMASSGQRGDDPDSDTSEPAPAAEAVAAGWS